MISTNYVRIGPFKQIGHQNKNTMYLFFVVNVVVGLILLKTSCQNRTFLKYIHMVVYYLYTYHIYINKGKIKSTGTKCQECCLNPHPENCPL